MSNAKNFVLPLLYSHLAMSLVLNKSCTSFTSKTTHTHCLTFIIVIACGLLTCFNTSIFVITWEREKNSCVLAQFFFLQPLFFFVGMKQDKITAIISSKWVGIVAHIKEFGVHAKLYSYAMMIE